MTTNNKDFKVKNGIVVSEGGTFGGPVSVGTPTDPEHAVTLDYLSGLSFTGSMAVSATPPSLPSSGDMWFDSSSGDTFVYYDSYWIQIMSSTGPQGEQGPQGDPGADGVGIPSAGTSGQVLSKVDGTDYNVQWSTIDLSGYQPKVSGVSDTEIAYLDGVTSSIQTQLNTKASASHTHSQSDITDLSTALGLKQDKVSGVSDIEISYLDGVTSAIQTQIDGKASSSHTHSQSDITGLSTALSNKQDKVSNVSDTEISYLDGVTSAIQTQLDGKVSTTGTNTISLTTTTDTDPLTIQSKNLHGGAGFAGFITFENTTTGATNTKKYLRMNSNGGIEIINSAYTANIFTLEDNGNLTGLNNITANGTVNATNLGDSGWQTVSSFSNSYSGTNVAYRKINNVVYLRGRVNGGTAGAGAFTLPSGYRPSTSEVVVPVQQYGTSNINYVTVGTDGVVVPNGSSAWLHSVVFPVG